LLFDDPCEPGFQPLVGATVILSLNGVYVTNSTTDATGHVEFTGLCGYRFDVSVIFPDCTSAQLVSNQLVANQLVANQLVAPTPTATDAKAEIKKMINGRKAAKATKKDATKAATTKEATHKRL